MGLGLMLLIKGIGFITDSKLFIGGEAISFLGLPFNLLVGIIGASIAALLLTNKKLPAAIVLIVFGFSIGLAFKTPSLALGPQMPSLQLPTAADLWAAFVLLAIPQIPLTLSNAIISTSEFSKKLFKGRASKVSCRALTNSIGIASLGAGLLGGVPMCHGAGGLAAHYRFGARTGGSNLMIGGIFIALALLFGATAISLLGLIPLSILGVLLVFAGIQLMRMLTDVKGKRICSWFSSLSGLHP